MENLIFFKRQDFLGGEAFDGFLKGRYGIFWLEYGEGEAVVNGKSEKIKDGTVCIVASDDTFSFLAEAISSAVCISFDISCLSNGRLLPLLEVFHVKDRMRCYENKKGEEIRGLISQIEELSENGPFYFQLLFAKLIELLCYLNTEEYKAKSESTKADRISVRVIEYISANLQKSFTLEDIASSLFVSKYYMSHMFKKETGVSVGEMVFIKKMEYADILLSSGVPAQRVSELTGFNSYSAFFRIYKRFRGHSPQTKLSEKRTKKGKEENGEV